MDLTLPSALVALPRGPWLQHHGQLQSLHLTERLPPQLSPELLIPNSEAGGHAPAQGEGLWEPGPFRGAVTGPPPLLLQVVLKELVDVVLSCSLQRINPTLAVHALGPVTFVQSACALSQFCAHRGQVWGPEDKTVPVAALGVGVWGSESWTTHSCDQMGFGDREVPERALGGGSPLRYHISKRTQGQTAEVQQQVTEPQHQAEGPGSADRLMERVPGEAQTPRAGLSEARTLRDADR